MRSFISLYIRQSVTILLPAATLFSKLCTVTLLAFKDVRISEDSIIV
jgi:hypothetical protein